MQTDSENQPVTQGEFSSVMGALKQDLDQIRGEMATKDELYAVRDKLMEVIARQTNQIGQILELVNGIDRQLKEHRDLPERVKRLETAVFN